MLSKYNSTWYFAPNLSLIASFSILLGIYEFIDMQRVENPSEWLGVLSSFLLIGSLVPLLEIALRNWNAHFSLVRLPSLCIFGLIFALIELTLLLHWATFDLSVEDFHLLISGIAVLISGMLLFASTRINGQSLLSVEISFWLLVSSLAFLCYLVSFSFLISPSTFWTVQDHCFTLEIFSVQSFRTLCSVLAALGLVWLVLITGNNSQIDAIAFEWAQKAIVITNARDVILRINKNFTESTGFTPQDAVGFSIGLFTPGYPEDPLFTLIRENVKNHGSWQGEIECERKNGEQFPCWLSVTGVKDAYGDIVYYVGMYIDITERKAAEEDMRRRAFYDPLTQLPNRLLLQERLKHCLSVERRTGKSLALLMLDLDRFKSVNDSLGHLAGDELLKQVATRITNRLREVDMVARLGGDEFIVLLEDISNPKDASRVAEDIISDLSQPFQLTQKDEVWIGASIGISLYHQHGDTPEVLMDHADKALYQAKDRGKGCFAYFSESLTLAARERIELEVRLRKAIHQNELRVYYQPQIDIATGRIVGAEALVRWEDPSEGLILPARFIPVAEESNLIVDIGEWVLRETCYQGRFWQAYGINPLSLAVNISPHQLKRIDLNQLIARILRETGFSPNYLELEITESGVMEDPGYATKILNSLRDQGIRLAIDDFGTGYSSLAYLKSFPLNVLKIDKSFIDDIPHSKDSMEIAATIIAMGRTLGLKVLAEGVETIDQLAFLRSHKCDTYQGFIRSQPLPAKEFTELLRIQQRQDLLNIGQPRNAELIRDRKKIIL